MNIGAKEIESAGEWNGPELKGTAGGFTDEILCTQDDKEFEADGIKFIQAVSISPKKRAIEPIYSYRRNPFALFVT